MLRCVISAPSLDMYILITCVVLPLQPTIVSLWLILLALGTYAAWMFLDGRARQGSSSAPLPPTLEQTETTELDKSASVVQ